MSRYTDLQATLRSTPRTWLVTGVAGFIGSNLLEQLLRLDQRVIGLDNFATGHRRNLEEVKSLVTDGQWARFQFIEGDICRLDDCRRACAGVDYVLHHAALGSVPRSIDDPLQSHAANVDGFLNMLVAARDAKVARFVYASSSSVYGDHPVLPKVESGLGRPLSPYAATKLMDEIYAGIFDRCYGLAVTGLRYFNVFGPRQDPNGAYAAVIPKWFATLLQGEQVVINGDGETSRDFCHVENVVQANLLAAALTGTPDASAAPPVYNVALGQRTTLKELYSLIRSLVARTQTAAAYREPKYAPERPGDIRHSLAEIGAARQSLGYRPTITVERGLETACPWYVARSLPGCGCNPNQQE
jgi:UDP-N-acetylglucosamine 4-epimerase